MFILAEGIFLLLLFFSAHSEYGPTLQNVRNTVNVGVCVSREVVQPEGG